MASLVRWEPFRDLMSLRHDVDRLFSDVGLIRPRPGDGERLAIAPAMDVFSRDEDLVMRVELPGIDAKDVDISVTDDMLTLRAERRENREVKEEDYLLRESSWGTMERSVRLPETAEIDNIHAEYTDGVLEITVPKAAHTTGRTRKIAIETPEAKRLEEHH